MLNHQNLVSQVKTSHDSKNKEKIKSSIKWHCKFWRCDICSLNTHTESQTYLESKNIQKRNTQIISFIVVRNIIDDPNRKCYL